jgi:hypothetical protein
MAEHAREHLNRGDGFVVNCTHQSNVLVMDDVNLSLYRSGQQARYFGGFYRRFPARISVPSSGYWNVWLEAPPGARYGMQTYRS